MTHASKTAEERKMMAAFLTAKDYADMASDAAAKAQTLDAEGHPELRDEWIHRAQVAASEAADALLRLEAAVLRDPVPVATHLKLRQQGAHVTQVARGAAARAKQLLG